MLRNIIGPSRNEGLMRDGLVSRVAGASSNWVTTSDFRLNPTKTKITITFSSRNFVSPIYHVEPSGIALGLVVVIPF